MLKTFTVGVLLLAGGLPQTGSAQRPPQSVTIGSVELRLNMKRDEVSSLLAPNYTISTTGMVTTRSGPPFGVVGTVSFSDSGLLTSVSRHWSPSDQQEGVPTAEALYGALSQITTASANRVRNTTVQVCECTVFLYSTFSSGAEVKHIDVWDGTKTVALQVVRGNAIPGGSVVILDESIGTAK